MRTSTSFLPSALLGGILLSVLGLSAWAGRVTVFTTEGRRMEGDVDPSTDDRELCLSFVSPRVTLRSRVAWDRVTSVVRDGAELPLDQVRRLAALEATRPLKAPTVQPAPRSEILWPDGRRGIAADIPASSPAIARICCEDPPAPPPAVIRAVDAEVFVANWDADADADGFAVRVLPVGTPGAVRPWNGTVGLTVFGKRVQVDPRVPTSLGLSQLTPELGRWTANTSVRDFADAGEGLFFFPFQRFDPARDLSIGPIGAAEVSLGVSGRGVFRTWQTLQFRDPWAEDFLVTRLRGWGSPPYRR